MSARGDRDFRGPETKPPIGPAPGSGVSDHRSKVHGKARSLPLVDPVGTAIDNASRPSPMNAASQCWHLETLA